MFRLGLVSVVILFGFLLVSRLSNVLAYQGKSCPDQIICLDNKVYDSIVGTWYAAWDWEVLGSPTGQGWFAHTRHKPDLGFYQSSNQALIAAHYKLLQESYIDLMIIDATNGLSPAGVNKNTLLWLNFLEQHNGSSRPLKLAVAFGACTWAHNIEDRMACQKNQADAIYSRYVGFGSYYRYGDKPLLINFTHTEASNYETDPYHNWDDPRFFVGFATGLVSRYPDLSRRLTHGTWGWVADTLPKNSIVIHTTPGWSRDKWRDGEKLEIIRRNGEHLIEQLLFAIKQNPDHIIIGAFNDFAEETFWEPALCDPSLPLSQEHSCSEQEAKDTYGNVVSDWYYQIVRAYAALRYGFAEDSCYREEDNPKVYCVQNLRLVHQKTMPSNKPVIVIPANTIAQNRSQLFPGDLNSDGKVDIFYYQKIITNFGQ